MSRLCKIGNTMNIKNYYGNLCTEMYEILHDKAPQDELDFYLSYAEKIKNLRNNVWKWSLPCSIFGIWI